MPLQGNLLRSTPAQPQSNNVVLRPEKNIAEIMPPPVSDAAQPGDHPGRWTSHREGVALSYGGSVTWLAQKSTVRYDAE